MAFHARRADLLPTSNDSIDQGVQDDEAVLRAFERSRDWQEHERWHHDNGGEAKLHVGEEPPAEERAAVRPQPAEMADEGHHAQRKIKVGWCECNSPIVRLILAENGEVKNRMAEPVAETNQYGVSAPAEATTYAGKQDTSSSYLGGASGAPDLYKPH